MKKLYLHFAAHVLLALGLSLLVASWLNNHSVFSAVVVRDKDELNAVGSAMRQLLQGQPNSSWDSLIKNSGYDDDFEIDYSATNDNEMSEPEYSVLKQFEQEIVDYDDGTFGMELYFPVQQEILSIVRNQPATEFLNLLLMVFAVFGICTAIGALALKPLFGRMKGIEKLAGSYRAGNWQTRNTDIRKDPIGKMGVSLEKMADRISVLVERNETLVSDQRDLMQALTHEFRTPMARMRFALEMNDDGTIDENSRAELSYALDDLTELVSEMLQYAHLKNQAPDLKFTPLYLNQLIRNSCLISRKAHPDADINFIASEDIQLLADAKYLHRAVENLIGNAAKYSNADHGIVQVSTEYRPDAIAIHVEDNGNGIPVAERQNVLKPFVRLDSSRSKKTSGNGLGLAIVQGVVARHGGTICIGESPIGGARVSITIPFKPGV